MGSSRLPVPGEEDENARLDARANQIRHLIETMDLLFEAFGKVRFSSEWPKELAKIQRWLKHKDASQPDFSRPAYGLTSLPTMGISLKCSFQEGVLPCGTELVKPSFSSPCAHQYPVVAASGAVVVMMAVARQAIAAAIPAHRRPVAVPQTTDPPTSLLQS